MELTLKQIKALGLLVSSEHVMLVDDTTTELPDLFDELKSFEDAVSEFGNKEVSFMASRENYIMIFCH